MRPYAPRLFTRAEWAAMTDAEREDVWEARRRAVEALREERDALQRLNDALTVERFGHG